ncbi:polyadenylate-binding protein 3 [Fundulus heteroclitus]|uniref:polyadenylate-binding protein 3 n=1 Tax=Fundulus heteroclitus TaxID=8078 RepID=UPI00165CC032|nr:polyadenylate-binding protein 3 [Fundulus heteroclitus]
MDKEDDLETLGEQLYSLIYPKHKENAAKLTGMLLELPVAVLSQMLQDEAMLTAAVEKALRALQLAPKSSEVARGDEDDVSEASDSLGEQLFELVDVYRTGHSQKITGMLLEQQKEAVLQLLSDPKLLEEHVNLALKTLKEQNIEETDLSDASEADETDRLGEKLFSLVEQVDPLHANDITGMLLEMDSASLHQLLADRAKLDVAVKKAQAALGSES